MYPFPLMRVAIRYSTTNSHTSFTLALPAVQSTEPKSVLGRCQSPLVSKSIAVGPWLLEGVAIAMIGTDATVVIMAVDIAGYSQLIEVEESSHATGRDVCRVPNCVSNWD
jgi:hypothetical protein